MADLIALRRASAQVVIDDEAPITLRGLRLRQVAEVAEHFPALQKLIVGGGTDVASLLAQVPNAADAVFAAALGVDNADPVPEWAVSALSEISGLPMETQLDLLRKIGELTFPTSGGLGPFVRNALAGLLPQSSSPSVSNGAAVPANEAAASSSTSLNSSST